MLTLTDITLRRGPRILFEGLSLAVHPGSRVGVVGRNGTGKSSLFQLLLGELAADAGDVRLPRGLSLATVEQETPSTEQSALDCVLDGDVDLRRTEATLADAQATGDAAAMAAAHERLNAIGGYAAEARAGAMLHGLGFTADAQRRPVSSFSGGWRMRLNLARALIRRADLLLLDEPTNHLDLDAVLWLQQTLASYDGTLLVISHDRDFLDAVTTHTLHLHDRRAQLYTGNYSSFELQRAERLANQAAQHRSQQRRIAHLQSFVDRFRAKASKARQAQARLKMIERLPKVAAVHAEAGFDFAFDNPERLPEPLLTLDDVAIGYHGRPLLDGIKLSLVPGHRVGLLGANGAGKSTLVKLLAGELEPLAGECLRDPYLNVGYFAQHQLDHLDVDAAPITLLSRQAPQLTEQQARDYLGRFLFQGDRVFEPVHSFSGGERARLALALLVRRRPNLLLLDEPTNHLDLDMRQALELALQEFAGAMVLVSHDRHMLRSTCDEFWLVADGGVSAFDGDLDDYAQWLRRRVPAMGAGAVDAAAVGADAAGTGTAPSRENARDRRRAAADLRAREKPLRDTLARLDKRMQQQRRRLAEIDAELADPDNYADAGASVDVPAMMKEQAELQRALDADEEAWLEAAQALEAATQG